MIDLNVDCALARPYYISVAYGRYWNTEHVERKCVFFHKNDFIEFYTRARRTKVEMESGDKRGCKMHKRNRDAGLLFAAWRAVTFDSVLMKSAYSIWALIKKSKYATSRRVFRPRRVQERVCSDKTIINRWNGYQDSMNWISTPIEKRCDCKKRYNWTSKFNTNQKSNDFSRFQSTLRRNQRFYLEPSAKSLFFFFHNLNEVIFQQKKCFEDRYAQLSAQIRGNISNIIYIVRYI